MSRIYLNPEYSFIGRLYALVPNPDSPDKPIEYAVANLRLGQQQESQSTGKAGINSEGVNVEFGNDITYFRWTEIDTPDITAISSGYTCTDLVIWKDPSLNTTHNVWSYSGSFSGRKLRIDRSEKILTTKDVYHEASGFYFRKHGDLEKDKTVSSFGDIGYNNPFHMHTNIDYSSSDFGSFGIVSINKTEIGEWANIGLRPGPPQTFIFRHCENFGSKNIFVGYE